MKWQLINKDNNNYPAIKQILINRGIKQKDIQHYLNLTDNDINNFNLLGRQNLKKALQILLRNIQQNNHTLVIVDVDCDGYTSAALLINYLHLLFPTWTENCLEWKMHEGKQHGLNDCIEEIKQKQYKLVICPDSASNDFQQHRIIKQYGGDVIVLDHHLADKISEDAVIINNQMSNYPNKQMSGVGIVWQFCRYIDNFLQTNYANNFLDLVALGLTGDMQSLHSFETKYLIMKGFKKQNIKNPFIDYMIEKNEFPLSKSDYKSNYADVACTPLGAAFFIVPFVNATTRSGTMNEKNLIFNSMLTHKAFSKVLSNKRGHKINEEQSLVIQAIRTVINIKNRQTKAEEKGLELLEKRIIKENLLQHKILIFSLETNQIQPTIRGLVANKMAAKYQRPCLVLTKDKDTSSGSGRGYTKTGITSLKDLLENYSEVIYVKGHHNAHGVSIYTNQIPNLVQKIDDKLKELPTETLYKVDYAFNELENNNNKILDIASMNDFWGQDIDRAYVEITFKITNKNFQIMKGNTLKITLPNNLSIIKFNATEEEICKFTTTGYIELEAVCKCNMNIWNNKVSPQLILEEYNIVDSSKYYF